MGVDKNVLLTEYRAAKHTLEQQLDSIRGIGDHATRMLRIVLLLLVGLGTAAAYSDVQVEKKIFDNAICAIGQQPICVRADYLAYLGSVLLFLGIFLLISATLGVGTAVRRPFHSTELDTVIQHSTSERQYLMNRLLSYKDKIEYNQQVISANRRAIFFADVSISLGFAVLSVLIVVLGTDRHLLWWTPFVVCLLAGFLVAGIQRRFPEDHSQRVRVPNSVSDLAESYRRGDAESD
ncbi:hypothetical protein [Halorussus ruber]|uniref:hypothetical protein n=1 Tax=Halorussus ruber TaxID=1126238 RepID=UPI0010922DA2|nr:hypothetical protein [Halorussus ruber]